MRQKSQSILCTLWIILPRYNKRQACTKRKRGILSRNTTPRLWSTSASRVDSLRVAASYHPTITRRWNPPISYPVTSRVDARAYCRPRVLHLTRGWANFNSPVLRGRRCLTSWRAGPSGSPEPTRPVVVFNLSSLFACVTIAPRYHVTLAEAQKQAFQKYTKYPQKLVRFYSAISRETPIFDNFRYYHRIFFFSFFFFILILMWDNV